MVRRQSPAYVRVKITLPVLTLLFSGYIAIRNYPRILGYLGERQHEAILRPGYDIAYPPPQINLAILCALHITAGDYRSCAITRRLRCAGWFNRAGAKDRGLTLRRGLGIGPGIQAIKSDDFARGAFVSSRRRSRYNHPHAISGDTCGQCENYRTTTRSLAATMANLACECPHLHS